MWDWPFHILEKDWGLKNINDFNIAFIFCQDYFNNYKPINSQNASTAETLYIQKQMMDIKNEYEGVRLKNSSDKLGSVSFSESLSSLEMKNYIYKMENIKVLK